MNFTCTQDNLLRGLSQVTPIAGRNSQLPILQYILLQVKDHVLHLTTTDLEIGVHTIIGGKMKEAGSCALPARRLYDYVQQLPATHPIVIQKKGNVVTVSTQGFKAQFPVADAEEFPLLPEVNTDKSVTIDPLFFCQALNQTVFAASREEVRPEIRSVFIQTEGEEMRIAATDSYRLAEKIVPYQYKHQFRFILPIVSAQEVVRLFAAEKSFQIIPHENHVAFQSDTVELTSRLVDGQYPDYRQIIPTRSKTTIRVQREELLRALKTVGVFLPRDSRRVELVINGEGKQLILQVQGGEVGQGRVELPLESLDGDGIEILLNIQYVMEGIQHIHGNMVELFFGGQEDPVVLRPVGKGNEYVYLVMPIQI